VVGGLRRFRHRRLQGGQHRIRRYFNGTGGTRAWNWAAMEILAELDPPRIVTLRPTAAVQRAANW
jgi:hypothetical protein